MPPHPLRPLAAALLLVLLLAVPAAAHVSVARPSASGEAALLRSLLRSRELWATIDVCNPADQPNTVGIRGSMPGDRHRGDTMFMSFRLQYMDSATKRWIELSSTATTYVAVGHGGSIRQGGRSFQLVPKTGRPPATLRGVVDFQWRRGKRVLQSGTRPTSAAHASRAGADPAGYSAASCLIG
jgi:hypothetical protein